MKVNPISRGAVNRPYYSFNASSVQPVQSIQATSPISPVEGQYASENAELSFREYQEKLDETKDYKGKNKNLEDKEFNSHKENHKFSKEEIETINSILNLFEKFNTNVDRIKKIDLARNQNNLDKIKQTYNKNSRFLLKMGISLDKLTHFELNQKTFTEEVIRDPASLKTLFEPYNGVLKQLISSFNGMLI